MTAVNLLAGILPSATEKHNRIFILPGSPCLRRTAARSTRSRNSHRPVPLLPDSFDSYRPLVVALADGMIIAIVRAGTRVKARAIRGNRGKDQLRVDDSARPPV